MPTGLSSPDPVPAFGGKATPPSQQPQNKNSTSPDKMQSGSGGSSSSQSYASSPGGAYAWADNPVSIGPWQLGFGTRILKDVAVGAAAVLLVVVGLMILAKPDISALAKSGIVPIPV